MIMMDGGSVPEIAPPREEADVAHGLYERFGVVKDRLVFETCELAVGESSRRPDLDQLHLVAVLPAAVCEPALDVRCPRDERVTVPEPDRLAQPARYFRTQMRDLAFEIERTADLHVTQRIVGAAKELHAPGDGHDIELTRAARS